MMTSTVVMMEQILSCGIIKEKLRKWVVHMPNLHETKRKNLGSTKLGRNELDNKGFYMHLVSDENISNTNRKSKNHWYCLTTLIWVSIPLQILWHSNKAITIRIRAGHSEQNSSSQRYIDNPNPLYPISTPNKAPKTLMRKSKEEASIILQIFDNNYEKLGLTHDCHTESLGFWGWCWCKHLEIKTLSLSLAIKQQTINANLAHLL